MPKKPRNSVGQPQKGRDYRLETYFIDGKMKHRRIPLIAGQPVEDFLRRNADDAFLAAEGHFEILGERECERNRAAPSRPTEADNGMIPF